MSNNHSDYLLLHATIEWLAFGRFFLFRAGSVSYVLIVTHALVI